MEHLFIGLYLGMILVAAMILTTISLAQAVTNHQAQCLSTFEASGHNSVYTVENVYKYDLCMNLPATNPNPAKAGMWL